MTPLTKRKTIVRAETATIVRGRALMIELRPYSVVIRQKGRRVGYEVDWESVYSMAAKKAAEKLQEERKAARKAKG